MCQGPFINYVMHYRADGKFRKKSRNSPFRNREPKTQYIFKFLWKSLVGRSKLEFTHVHKHAYTHTHTHTHKHTNTHAHAHTEDKHTHTRTHTRTQHARCTGTRTHTPSEHAGRRTHTRTRCTVFSHTCTQSYTQYFLRPLTRMRQYTHLAYIL